MPIESDSQLTQLLKDDLTVVIDNVTDILMAELKDYIQEDVYNRYRPYVKRYHRTFQFKNSWVKDISVNQKISIRLYSDPNKMDYNPDMFQHGSKLSGDVSNALAEILNETLTGLFFDFAITAENNGWWRDADRPFWDEFEDYLSNGKIFDLIDDEFKKLGITFKRI
jgi:hypothetical protein